MTSNSPPVAVVSGGRRGIGRGIAYALAARGWDLVVLDVVDDEATRDTLTGVRERGGRAAFVCADIAGRVNAGGMGLVAASDVVVAGSQAQFSLSEILFGRSGSES